MFQAKLVSRTDLTSSVFLLRFHAPGFQWIPGQFTNLWIPVELHGTVTKKRKSYTIASVAGDDHFELCIKEVAGGLTSAILSKAEPGQVFECDGPLGHFTLHDFSNELLFLGTGTGVSPFRTFLQHLDKEGSSRPVTLVFGVRSEKDLFFHDEFTKLAEKHPWFSYIPTLSRPGDSWTGKTGYVQTHLKELVNDPLAVDVYLCGLVPMVSAAAEKCKEIGIPRENVVREVYT
ncbi:MAG: FAD-dependent oxidoreductase [Candidatus Woesearchaeota archaeon]